MSQFAQLKVETRSEAGKGPNRQLRNAGKVPGIFYNSAGENIKLQADFIELYKVYTQVGHSNVVELMFEQDGTERTIPTLITELSQHPTKKIYNHVDFQGIDLDKKVTVSIPVKTTGRAKGVVVGGKLEVYRERINVTCLPADIPSEAVVDITALERGQRFFIEDVQLPEGVTAASESNFAVLGISAPRGRQDSDEETEE
jgi:large subunit ribosomal protein L25